MRLTYWYARCKDDSDCYSIVAKTKKEVKHQLEERGEDRFEEPVKCIIEYNDAFDLFQQSTSEGGGRGVGAPL